MPVIAWTTCFLRYTGFRVMGYKAGVKMNWSCDLGRRFSLDMFDDPDSMVIEAARLKLIVDGDGHKLLRSILPRSCDASANRQTCLGQPAAGLSTVLAKDKLGTRVCQSVSRW